MNILCRLGFHNWKIIEAHVEFSGTYIVEKCKRKGCIAVRKRDEPRK